VYNILKKLEVRDLPTSHEICCRITSGSVEKKRFYNNIQQ